MFGNKLFLIYYQNCIITNKEKGIEKIFLEFFLIFFIQDTAIADRSECFVEQTAGALNGVKNLWMNTLEDYYFFQKSSKSSKKHLTTT